jgi:RimJ/RimL family protein N-acetyltransferase
MNLPQPAAALRLRPTMQSDLEFVISVEQHPENRPYITPWDRTQHEGAIRFPDFRHFIVEAGPGYPSAGFVILQGCRNPHGSIELKRMVLSPDVQGRGYGRLAIGLVVRLAFRDLGAHRFWLDVKSRNLRAQAVYRSEGFVEEGRLRESVKVEDGYDSLVVMSMLAAEHEARLRAGRPA